jgi:hypothetical protein
MVWLSDWAKRRKITIDHTVLTGDIAYFPVLVYLSADSGKNSKDLTSVFTELGSDANRKKIAITKDDGTTQLYVEIEKWDNANKKAWLWVSKDDWNISSTADTIIYIYYDNTKSDNNTYVGDKGSTPAKTVWAVQFKMVQHMDEAASPLVDSTSYGANAIEGSHAPTYGVDGKVGKAVQFNGSSDYFDIASLANEAPYQFTIEAWVILTDNGWDIVFPRTEIYTGQYKDWFLGVSGGKAHVEANIGTTTHYQVTGDTTISDGVPHHIVAVYLGSGGLQVYVDGELDGEVSHVGGNVYNYYAAASIGVGHYDAYYFEGWFNGKIDELRYMAMARPANWVKFDYYSQNDNLITWDDEESTGAVPEVITHGATDVGVY